MSSPRFEMSFPSMPKGVKTLMIVLVCGWLSFLLFDDLAPLAAWLIGDSDKLFHGQIWRLLTAIVVYPSGDPLRPLMTLLLLYYFVPPLERAWGIKRLFLFLFGCGAAAFLCEALIYQLAPSIARQQWYGGMIMADAALVAWALSNRHQTINLFFVLPIKPMWMIALMAGWQLVSGLIMRQSSAEGAVAPLAAMLFGWLFSDAGPGRRAFLRYKLQRIEGEVTRLSKKRPSAASRAPHLRVIKGGADDDDKPTLH